MILQAQNLRKSFGKLIVLDKVSLTVKKGETHAIMGASGEGKTTLLHILGTLESFDSGTLHFMGKTDWNPYRLRRKHIGFIFQSYNLLEDFSLLENVLMPIYIARENAKEKKEKALFLLERVGLKTRVQAKVKVLSGGERQRAAIARSLIHDPDILLADEPTGNLDHKNSQMVHELLLSVKELGKSLVIVTHDEELANLCDHRYLLKDGLLFRFS